MRTSFLCSVEFLVCISVCIAVGCAPKLNSSHESRAADPRVENSLSPVPSAKVPQAANVSMMSDGNLGFVSDHVMIQKSALGKEFLLHGSLIPQTQAATSRGLKGRVVVFQRHGDGLFLMESSKGHVVTQELPSRLILARLPIVAETETAITMDFNAGMDDVFRAPNYFVSDQNGRDYQSQFSATRIRQSFLSSVAIHDNLLDIRQIAQLEGAPGFDTYEVRYFLTPYLPSADFVPRETSDFKWVGYFEVTPVIEEVTGYTQTRIARWDHRKPVIYSVSANTPAHLVQAVKEGVLYWNKAFGSEVVRVQMAPAGRTAPDPVYNIIQWVPNDSAGVAYADMLADPRTGEILHAQVYLTSVFDVTARSNLPARIRKLRLELGSAPQHRHRLEAEELCHFSVAQALADHWLQFLEQDGKNLSDEAIRRVAQDYLRITVAHEVGHTLGLRHNFAGSLHANVSIRERDRMFMDYVFLGNLPSQETSFTSSVMDYSSFFEDILVSAGTQAGAAALPYDREAIEWGYDGKGIDPRTAPLYCSESHMAKYADCKTFDAGADPVSANQESLRNVIETLPSTFIEAFILGKTARDSKLRKGFERVELDPQAFANSLLDILKSQIAWFSPQGRPSLRMDRRFDFRTEFNGAELLKMERDWVGAQVTAAGGVENTLFPFLPTEAKPAWDVVQLSRMKLLELLKRPEYVSGVGYDGKPFAFSEEELAYVRKEGEKYFSMVEEKLLLGSVKLLSEAVFSKDLHTEAVEKALGQTASLLVLKTVGGSDVFQYSEEIREAALKLLSPALGEWNDWSLNARTQVKAHLTEMIKKVAGVKELKEIDFKGAQYTRPQRQWLIQQMTYLTRIERM